MKKWTRKINLDWPHEAQQEEIWQYEDNGKILGQFPVQVIKGKSLDILGLKGTSLQEILDYAKVLKKTADKLYAPDNKTKPLLKCPCCDVTTDRAVPACAIFGIPYKRCWQCGHAFVATQIPPKSLEKFFSDSEECAVVYTDKKSLAVRQAQIIKPKLEWIKQIFLRHFDYEVTSVLDVGAGGGHFVAGCLDDGIKAKGFELSKASITFAKEIFNVDLISNDFLTYNIANHPFDVLTFWGLLEYTPEPRNFIRRAQEYFKDKDGMLVVEVPRFDCISTSIQQECPDTIARHLDPTSHVNCFSDASLATALYLEGFKPIAAWYFGMDAYEMLTQMAIKMNSEKMVSELATLIPNLQASMDAVHLCDDIIVAAVPIQ